MKRRDPADQPVWLRPFEPSDGHAVAKVIDDPQVLRFTTWQGPSDRAAAERLIRKANSAASQRHRRDYQWAVIRADELVGVAGVRIESRRRREASLRAMLRRDVWGQGIGTRVVRLLMQVAFEELGMDVVFADPRSANLAARRALEKAGMEATERGDDRLVVYSTDREAWVARRRS